MGTTLQQRRQAGLFGKRFTALFGILALVALVISPAAAQPLGAGIVTSPGGAFDPCRFSPQISFAAESPSIGLGTSTNLSWSVQTPRGCGYSFSMIVLARPQINLSPGAPQDWAIWTSSIGVAAQPQGSLQVQPAFNTVYMLIVAWGPNNAIYSAPIKVAVSLPLANLKCFDVANPSTSLMTAPTGGRAAGFTLVRPCRNRVTIDANNLAPLLVQALGTPNTTVIVADGVELDLTPHLGGPDGLGGPITIADGVQLIGGRIAEPGKRFQPGPRLYVKPGPFNASNWPYPLFQIMGDHVRISGVRIEGPGAPPDAWRTMDHPQGYTAAVRLYDRMNIEIDHNELDGWTTYAVGVFGPEDVGFGENRAGRVWDTWTKRAWSDSSGIHYPVDPEPIWIHDNYFHDNFLGTPFEGYGVDMGLGGHALIERNVFDNHFHAIATDGNFGTGYRAYRNLAFHNEEQVFDMHGRRCPPAPAWSCPPGTPAAHDIDIRWNSFSWPGAPAIKLMGTPELQPYGAVVQSNVFAHRSLGPDESSCHLGNPYTGDAVVMCGDGLLLGVGPLDNPTYNLLGVQSWFDPAHLSVSCDFDGDGINDSFITTGETWWFQSRDHRNGPTPWVYLNANTLLVENVSLGYFSTDAVRNHVCDVATIDGGYKGGTGQYGPLD
jgi:hypothetical protein